MSFRSLLDRVVTIQRVDEGALDEYGNPSPSAGSTTAGVPARRQALDLEENVRGRDQQARRFRYFLPAGVALSGHDRIVDDDGTFEVDGPPERITRRTKEHHVEAVAYLVEG